MVIYGPIVNARMKKKKDRLECWFQLELKEKRLNNKEKKEGKKEGKQINLSLE